jgi:hypothetical protein
VEHGKLRMKDYIFEEEDLDELLLRQELNDYLKKANL